MICSCCLLGCSEWQQKPDGPVEEFVETVIESAVEEGAALAGVELDITIDLTPDTPELPVRSEGKPQGD
jgi:hypothetical protein